ncbi:Murein DD-endopeptidase MepM and murein hydrolase activator NlpD [Sesbania bispinosa]|nr:Murein DD-endopeptidase MepM and murein hydrolase activator NlpD [Sesbania bispinosa]
MAINLESSEDEDHNEYPVRDPVTVQPGANPTVGTTGTHTVPTAGSPCGEDIHPVQGLWWEPFTATQPDCSPSPSFRGSI